MNKTMKKTMLFSLSLILGLATMMAQNDNKPQRPERPQLTVEQRAQIITDRIAKSYDLTADQKTKLQELNQKTLAQRGQFRVHRHEGKRPEGAPKAKPEGQLPQAKGQGSHRFGYINELKEILTPEQFQTYLTDKMIERSLMPQPQARGHRGNFGGPKAKPQGQPEKQDCCKDKKDAKQGCCSGKKDAKLDCCKDKKDVKQGCCKSKKDAKKDCCKAKKSSKKSKKDSKECCDKK